MAPVINKTSASTEIFSEDQAFIVVDSPKTLLAKR